MTRLALRGAAGFVSDGPVRDSGAIAAMNFPVFCAGASAPLNLIHHHAVDLDVPIACGGVTVIPGDIIVADDDGVVVLPVAKASKVIEESQKHHDWEEFSRMKLMQGAPLQRYYPLHDDARGLWRQ